MIAGGSKKYDRLIDNCIQARDRAQYPEFQNFWNVTLKILLRKYKRKIILN